LRDVDGHSKLVLKNLDAARQFHGRRVGLFRPSEWPEISSHQQMSWIQEHLRQNTHASSENQPSQEGQFRAAARARWQRLGEELRADVAAFNSQQSEAEFAQEGENLFRLRNSKAGLELTLTADFENHNVRYDYSALDQQNAGVPEGGMLSMRQSQDGGVEFYSADEQLTSKETCNVLLEPMQFPNRPCAQ
jgi:hypothetical protein